MSYHVLHIRSRWVHLTSQFVMEIQDALHVIVCDGSFASLLGCPPFTILIHVLFQKFLQQSGVRNHHRWNRSGHEEQCGHSEPLRSCTHHNEWPRGFPGKISKTGSSTPFGYKTCHVIEMNLFSNSKLQQVTTQLLKTPFLWPPFPHREFSQRTVCRKYFSKLPMKPKVKDESSQEAQSLRIISELQGFK